MEEQECRTVFSPHCQDVTQEECRDVPQLKMENQCTTTQEEKVRAEQAKSNSQLKWYKFSVYQHHIPQDGHPAEDSGRENMLRSTGPGVSDTDNRPGLQLFALIGFRD